MPRDETGELMTTGEVASLCRVDPKTVARWASEGRISSVRTPGGHRRYDRQEIMGLIEATRRARRERGSG